MSLCVQIQFICSFSINVKIQQQQKHTKKQAFLLFEQLVFIIHREQFYDEIITVLR